MSDVRPRGPGRWIARCPAHEDRHPSLSIAHGERGVLLHCFAGCPLSAIVAALGLEVRDLFDGPGASARGRAPVGGQPRRWTADDAAAAIRRGAEQLALRAEQVLAAASGLANAAEWTDEELDAALNAVADAYHDLDRAALLEDVACHLRARGLAAKHAQEDVA